jgi:Zn-dependent metalloprotease
MNLVLMFGRVLSFFLFAALTFAADFSDGLSLLQESANRNMISKTGSPVQVRNYLTPMETLTDTDGNRLISYSKRAGGIAVYGEKKLVVFPADETLSRKLAPVRGFSTKELIALESLDHVSTEPKITAFRAFAIAMNDLRRNREMNSTPLPEHLRREPELVVLNTADGYRLVYHLTLPGKHEGFNAPFDYFIDANDETIVNKVRGLFSETGTGYALTDDKLHSFPVATDTDGFKLQDQERNLNVYNSSTRTFSTDKDATWVDEGETRKQNQKAEVELYLNFMKTIDYYKNRFGLLWKDGSSAVKGVAHVRENFNNAYFSPWEGAFFFGDGSGDEQGFDYLTKALDVVAHEFQHGILSQLSPLTYSGESGALNEHFSDFFGAMVDDENWTVGEAIAVGGNYALRNMQAPAWGHANLLKDGMTYAEWREMNKNNGLKMTLYPETVQQKIICGSYEDNGGVHINCSIFNRFAYLAVTGDGLGSKGLGRELMADIYVRLMKDKYLARSATFAQFKEKLLACATLHLEKNAKKDVYLTTLEKAFKAIGM